MINIKFKDKTPNFSKQDLCESCKRATIIKGERSSEIKKLCNANYGENSAEIKYKVTECSKYAQKTDKSLEEMENIAFVMMSKLGKPIGFVHAKQLTQEQKDEVLPSRNIY